MSALFFAFGGLATGIAAKAVGSAQALAADQAASATEVPAVPPIAPPSIPSAEISTPAAPEKVAAESSIPTSSVPASKSEPATVVIDAAAAAQAAWTKTWGIEWVNDWDNPRQRGIRERTDNKYTRQIIMIRHGQYQNENSKDDTIRSLTELGQKQATATGKYLRSTMKDSPLFTMERPGFVYVSTMLRAKQTADLIMDELEDRASLRVVEDSLLREKFPCDPQPKYNKKAKVETAMECEKAFEKYFYRPPIDTNSCDLIVGHGNMIRYFVCRSLQLPPEAWLRFSLPHCSITTVNIRGNGRVSVNSIGGAGHLEAALQTVHNLP